MIFLTINDAVSERMAVTANLMSAFIFITILSVNDIVFILLPYIRTIKTGIKFFIRKNKIIP